MLDSHEVHYTLAPAAFARECLRLNLDPLQSAILDSTARRGILCCTRQWGKSTITAAKAVHQAIHWPESTILVAAPAERQSGILVSKCGRFFRDLHISTRTDGRHRSSLVLANGSQIIGLPHDERTIRGFSAPALILIDEAAAVPDDLYHALSPMLVTNDGALWLMSTPREKRGFFYREWITPDNGWAKFTATAFECPRILKTALERQQRLLPKAVFEQEYLCVFRSTHQSLFQEEDLQAALLPPPPHAGYPTRAYLGLDLGQRADHSALAVLYLHQIPTGRRNLVTYEHEVLHRLQLKQIHQIPLGTPYPDVARFVRNVLRLPELEGRSTLIVDAGGPGLAFIDFLRTEPVGASLIKLNITGAGSPHLAGSLYHVSRAQLLTSLAVLFESRVLHIPANAALLDELRAIQSDFTSQAGHDDLVMSLALAAWQASTHWRSVLKPD